MLEDNHRVSSHKAKEKERKKKERGACRYERWKKEMKKKKILILSLSLLYGMCFHLTDGDIFSLRCLLLGVRAVATLQAPSP